MNSLKYKVKSIIVFIVYIIFRCFDLIYGKIQRFCFSYIVKYKTRSFSKNLQIDYPVTIIYPEYLHLGDNCRINRNSFIHAQGRIFLGNNVTISGTARIISTSYSMDDWIENSVKKEHISKPIIIGDNCWICAGATVLSGVKIARGVIVAANSLVNHDIQEEYVLVAGIPAKVVKKYK